MISMIRGLNAGSAWRSVKLSEFNASHLSALAERRVPLNDHQVRQAPVFKLAVGQWALYDIGQTLRL
jgi:hypothetical protein